MIIHIKQTKIRTLVELALTLVGWGFFFLFLFNLIQHLNPKLSLSFYSLSLSNINAILLFTLLVLGFNTFSLLSWRGFNKRKYGHLTRRRFPEPATDLELAELFGLPESQVHTMKNATYIDV